MKASRLLILLALPLASLLSSCLYTSVRTPGWYYSQNFGDVKGLPTTGRLGGESCARSILWAVYTGDESFDAAVQQAIDGKADLLYDVRTDYYTESYVLGLYLKKCTRVTGMGVRLSPALSPPAKPQ